MNIFVLDTDPKKAAQMHCDKHVVKMVLETAQLLSTAHHHFNTEVKDKVYKKTHVNHPCSIWVRDSVDNYKWTFNLLQEPLIEFTSRRNKVHKTQGLVPYLSNVPPIQKSGLTPFAQAMPDKYKNLDPVVAYRNYYANDKKDIAFWNWPNSKKPYWFNNG